VAAHVRFGQDGDGGCCYEVVVWVFSGYKGDICGIGKMKIMGLWLVKLSSCCAIKR